MDRPLCPSGPPPAPGKEVHLLLCLADHYEPKAGAAPPERVRVRVEHLVGQYPRQLGDFRDSDGRPPRYSFFYPFEDYEPEYLDLLAGLCRAGFAEVEIHLHHHHDDDTAERLRDKLLSFKHLLAERHGLLSRRRQTGELAYGFIHGNWALCNARADGRWCGVNKELAVLRARVQAPSRPDWFFVKLHTHGAPEESHEVLLGEPMRRFHAGLARLTREDAHFHYHYVTAREMYNLARAAEAGWKGGVAEARDYELTWNGGVPAGGATVSPQPAGSRSG